jgi:hypothetical protein
MHVRRSSGIFPRIGFTLQVVRLWHKGIRRAVSGHMLIEGEEVKEQIDNKGHSLISCDAPTVPVIDHGLVLVCFFKSEPSLHSVSLSFLGISMWLFGLLGGVGPAEQICC